MRGKEGLQAEEEKKKLHMSYSGTIILSQHESWRVGLRARN